MRSPLDADPDAYETGVRQAPRQRMPVQPPPQAPPKQDLAQAMAGGLHIHVHTNGGPQAQVPMQQEEAPVAARPWRYSAEGMKWTAATWFFWLLVLGATGFGVWWLFQNGYLEWLMPSGGN